MILSSTEWLHRISQVTAYKVRSQTNFVRVCLNIALRNFEMFLLIGIYELVMYATARIRRQYCIYLLKV